MTSTTLLREPATGAELASDLQALRGRCERALDVARRLGDTVAVLEIAVNPGSSGAAWDTAFAEYRAGLAILEELAASLPCAAPSPAHAALRGTLHLLESIERAAA